MGDAWSASQSSGNKASIQSGLPVGSYPERSGVGTTLAVFAVTVPPRLPSGSVIGHDSRFHLPCTLYNQLHAASRITSSGGYVSPASQKLHTSLPILGG